MLPKILNQSEEREREHLFQPSCQGAAVVLSAKKEEKSAEQETWACGLGHGDLEWLHGSLCGKELLFIRLV